MSSALRTSANGRPSCWRNGSATVRKRLLEVFGLHAIIDMTKPSLALVGT